MASNGHCFVEWKEEFVSQERGNRVVHYFLKDSAGDFILAIVGTERSVRHMFYVVAEEFVQVYGKESSVHAGFKWRSRREVVDWLTSMLSNLPGIQPKSPRHVSTQALGSPECPINKVNGPQTQVPNDTGRSARNLKRHNPGIVWSGIAWRCGKQLKHYPAFCRNGTTIAIQSFVFVMGKGENHYLAYLEDMYEDKRGQKKVKVRWFHHNQEVKGVVPLQNPHPKEVFITPYAQVISAECIDGLATVLTPAHYEICFATFPHAVLARIHICSRQFKSNKVKLFDLRKLRGYYDQPILSCLGPNPFQKPSSICYGLNGEEDEEWSPDDNVKLGAKRSRSGRGCPRFVTDRLGVKISGRGPETTTHRPSYRNLKYGFPGRRLLNHVERQPLYKPLYNVDEKIELLCQDSGIRGCWFRCTVLQVSRKQLKVCYDDVMDEDECGNLEEWIPAFKLAMPDKLGMRCSGRLTIRPAPPKNKSDLALEIGAAVDAWWSDGWWEGVVTGVSESGDDNFQVYFPGENLFLNILKKDLRISRDWLGDQWIDIEAKPDIFSVISIVISPDSKLSTSSTIAKDVRLDDFSMSYTEIPSNTELNNAEEEKLNIAASASSDELLEGMERINGKKAASSIGEEGIEDDDDAAGDNHDNDNLDDVNNNDDNNNDINIADDKDNEGKLDVEAVQIFGQSCEPGELTEGVA